nr:hypothetical protein [Mycolicibacterium mengxianglii]
MTAVVGDCDSGDEIVRAADLPVDVCAGDLIAVAGTGGSQHSHGSPVVAVCEGHAMRAR